MHKRKGTVEKKKTTPRAQQSYPDFFILPLHRLLQVRYFSNKTLLFHIQLTDLLNSMRSKSLSRRENSDTCICRVHETRAVNRVMQPLGDKMVTKAAVFQLILCPGATRLHAAQPVLTFSSSSLCLSVSLISVN